MADITAVEQAEQRARRSYYCESRPFLAIRRFPSVLHLMNSTILADSFSTLFGELVDGPAGTVCFVLNRGDVGLLRSLDRLSAEAASESAHGGATIAAHVDHLRYGLSLMNRWSGGENPWDDADWTQSWRISKVTDAEWKKLRADLGGEVRHWLAVLREPRDLDGTELTGVIASIVHLAYHLGAIRQIDRAARGPRA
jgi:hypothetical protein